MAGKANSGAKDERERGDQGLTIRARKAENIKDSRIPSRAELLPEESMAEAEKLSPGRKHRGMAGRLLEDA